MSEKVPKVYFLQVSRGDPGYEDLHIKIGYTAKPISARVKSLKASSFAFTSPHVRLLALVRASQSAEGALHRHFRDLLISGPQRECFAPGDALTGYIRWLRNQWFVYVDDDNECEEVESLDAMPFDLWCPGAGRHMPPPDTGLFAPPDGPLNMPPRELTGDDYYTNPIILDAAREALGGEIDLDPATHAVANRNVRARRFFTKGDNGLTREWAGRVWMNPPFSAWNEWSQKALIEWRSGRISAMCALAANRTISARYFAPFLAAADACCSTTGRIRFGGIAGDALNDGHTIYYFGPHRERFMRAFEHIGKVWMSPRKEAS